jgi:hypothetical protein
VAATLDFAELAKHVKSSPKLAHIRLLGLLADGKANFEHESAGLFEDFQMKFDRKGMLHSLERLADAVSQSEHALTTAGR